MTRHTAPEAAPPAPVGRSLAGLALVRCNESPCCCCRRQANRRPPNCVTACHGLLQPGPEAGASRFVAWYARVAETGLQQAVPWNVQSGCSCILHLWHQITSCCSVLSVGSINTFWMIQGMEWRWMSLMGLLALTLNLRRHHRPNWQSRLLHPALERVGDDQRSHSS